MQNMYPPAESNDLEHDTQRVGAFADCFVKRGTSEAPKLFCAGLLLPILYIWAGLDRCDIIEAEKWSKQNWVGPVNCTVIQSGIQYNPGGFGFGMYNNSAMVREIDCALADKVNVWQSKVGYCGDTSDTTYSDMPYALPTTRRLHASQLPSRRLMSYRRRRSSTWRPWIYAQVPESGSMRTDMSFYGNAGFPEYYNQWEAEKVLNAVTGNHVPCYYMPDVPRHCVVALRDPKTWVMATKNRATSTFARGWFLLPLSMAVWLLLCTFCVCTCIRARARNAKLRSHDTKSAFLNGRAADAITRKVEPEPLPPQRQGLLATIARVFTSGGTNQPEDDRYQRCATAQQLAESFPEGHWSQWSDSDIDVASNALFAFYDKNSSGKIDIKEVQAMMNDLGVWNQRDVRRIMAQLDHDKSGMLDRREFGDLCRQVFWNGREDMVQKEILRQTQILHVKFIMASGLSKNRAYLMFEMVAFSLALLLSLYVVGHHANGKCDVSMGLWMKGVPALLGFWLAAFSCIGLSRACSRKTRRRLLMFVQGMMWVLAFLQLLYSLWGIHVARIAKVCDEALLKWGFGEAVAAFIFSAYLFGMVIWGVAMAYMSVANGTALATLGEDENPFEDSDYEFDEEDAQNYAAYHKNRRGEGFL